MISKLKISGLKSIADLELECKNLNIIAGTNSSGKSTIIQAILLFFQTYPASGDTTGMPKGLNGNFVSLGDFRENKSIYITTSKIVVGMEFTGFPKELLEVYFEEDEVLQCSINKIVTMETLKYLSCHRIGSQDIYKKNYATEGIGENGEYAIHYLEQNKSHVVDSSLIKDTSSETLSAQVNYWLKYIVNTTILTEDIQGTDVVKASYKVGDGKPARPKNVGSGISFLISLLILCLSSRENNILIIENPEIHLHPKAQSKVCEFLYFIALSGRQIFVETHSDHIFNGVRAGIAANEINPAHVSVNFLELDKKGCTKNTVIRFGNRGRILNYTEGLFDQFDIDLNVIFNDFSIDEQFDNTEDFVDSICENTLPSMKYIEKSDGFLLLKSNSVFHKNICKDINFSVFLGRHSFGFPELLKFKSLLVQLINEPYCSFAYRYKIITYKEYYT